MIPFLFISGISTKKNVAINASKDFTGSHLWGSSSIPFGGTLPSRGAHGNFTVTFRLFVDVVVKEVQSNGLLLLTIRHKYNPRWIHAIFLQKRQRLCRSQRASGSFSGDNSIKWAQIWAFFDTQFLKKEFIKGKKPLLSKPAFRVSLLPFQIMQHGGLAGARWTRLPTCHRPTKAPRVCCLARRCRLFMGERTGLPNTDTASGLAPELRSVP